MAPVKIKYVVSFTSQDPKYPVENLLLEEECCPWLCSPHDRSRQLKAELQLKQASHIGYVDVGNCGSALLQIEVGRSSWRLDQQYLTLLPATSLMTPADAKLDKNRSGVRMFKEGDFLASALREKWDRVRLICSQPFNKHAQFGLTFLQIRTPLDVERAKAEPLSASSEDSPALSRSPWLSHASICRTFFPELPSHTEKEMALRNRLQQLDPASSSSIIPGGRSPTCISRPAMMVLKAASVRKRTLPPVASSSSTAEGKEEGEACVMESKQEFCKRRDRVKTSRRKRLYGNMKRCAPASVRSRNISQSQGRAKCRRRKTGNLGGDQEEEEEEEEKVMGKEEEDCPEGRRSRLGTCPVCAGLFPATLLAAHASSCGEEDCEAGPSSSALPWGEPVETWVTCPLCQSPFPSSEVEGHASSCGEPAELSQSSPSWLWVE